MRIIFTSLNYSVTLGNTTMSNLLYSVTIVYLYITDWLCLMNYWGYLQNSVTYDSLGNLVDKNYRLALPSKVGKLGFWSQKIPTVLKPMKNYFLIFIFWEMVDFVGTENT